MAQLTRNLFIPCIDTSAAKDGSGYTPIDLSTIFELSWNPQEETKGYICYKVDSTEITGYQPELPQEIVLDSDNPIYNFVHDFGMKFPVGTDAEVPVLLIEPNANGETVVGREWKSAVISMQNMNTVDGKLSFTLKLNGDKRNGTVAITVDSQTGVKTIAFTPAA